MGGSTACDVLMTHKGDMLMCRIVRALAVALTASQWSVGRGGDRGGGERCQQVQETPEHLVVVLCLQVLLQQYEKP